ncbi:MAG: hypothetical protein EXR93_05055 [Gemmatimonadetes bacterium]|nr:hypothetical protein [Gemmatimonadota bacterium]
MRVRQTVLGFLLVVLASASAHGQEPKARQPRKDRNLITQEELEKSGVQNLEQAIRKLRPAWLASRGSASIAGGMAVSKEQAMMVYLDTSRLGGVSELAAFPMEQVKEVRYYSAEAAVSRFGSDNVFGAIEVVTKK